MSPSPEVAAPDALPLKKGHRQTEQRKAVFEALMARADHPSAVEVFLRVKTRMPSISLATVYNCLETLAASGQVRMVNHEREPSRYCANLSEHAHLFCSHCGSVTDLPVHTPVPPDQIWHMPEGVTISQQEVSFRGTCAKCGEQSPARSLNTPLEAADRPVSGDSSHASVPSSITPR
jgi:Fur family peroxide stress response transcriptional regulator